MALSAARGGRKREVSNILSESEVGMNLLSRIGKATCCLWVAIALAPITGHAQVRSSCPLITADEAATVLGGKPSRTEEASACTYALPGDSNTLILVLQYGYGEPTMQRIFADSRNDFVRKGAVVKDEPSIGPPTFSFVNGDKQERASGFFVLKGDAVLMVVVSEKNPSGPLRSTDKLDRLRPILKKAAGRT